MKPRYRMQRLGALAAMLCVATLGCSGADEPIGAAPGVSECIPWTDDGLATLTTFSLDGNPKITVLDANRLGAVTAQTTGPGGFAFVRNFDGSTERIDIPGALTVLPTVINDAGTIAGSYTVGESSRGFMRTTDGVVETFSIPESAGFFADTLIGVTDQNGRGEVVGRFLTGETVSYAFHRNVLGEVREVAVPDGQSVTIDRITEEGVIIGEYRPVDGSPKVAFRQSESGETILYDNPEHPAFGFKASNEHGDIVYGAIDSFEIFGDTSSMAMSVERPSNTSTQIVELTDDRSLIGRFRSEHKSAQNVGFIQNSDGELVIFQIPGTDSFWVKSGETEVVAGSFSRPGADSGGFVITTATPGCEPAN